MHIISVKQPWAHLIIHAGKDIENRSWNTRYRGPLAIHASKKPDPNADLWDHLGLMQDQLAYGVIIGTVDLVDVVEESDSPWFEGPYGLVLRHPTPMDPPVEWKGQLGIRELDDDVVRELVR